MFTGVYAKFYQTTSKGLHALRKLMIAEPFTFADNSNAMTIGLGSPVNSVGKYG